MRLASTKLPMRSQQRTANNARAKSHLIAGVRHWFVRVHKRPQDAHQNSMMMLLPFGPILPAEYEKNER